MIDTRTWTQNLDKHSDDIHLCKGTPSLKKKTTCVFDACTRPPTRDKELYINKNKPQKKHESSVSRKRQGLCSTRAHGFKTTTTTTTKTTELRLWKIRTLDFREKATCVYSTYAHRPKSTPSCCPPSLLFLLFFPQPRTPPSHACAITAVSLCAAHYKFKTNPTQLVHFRRGGKKSIHTQTPKSYLTARRLHPNGHSENCAAKADINWHLQAVIAFGSKISRLFEVISLYKLFQSVLMGVIIASGNFKKFDVQTKVRLFQFDR